MSIRTVIVDDHAVVRSGLRLVIESEKDIEVVAEAADARNAVFATLQDVRRLAVQLRPKALDDFGLVPALERLSETFAEQAEVEVHVEAVLGDERLPREIETALYRIGAGCAHQRDQARERQDASASRRTTRR